MSSGHQSPAEEKGSTRIAKATAAVLIKFLVKLRFQAKRSQTKQRWKTFAMRGEEIGLKAVSHPSGTRARDCDRTGAADGPKSCCQAVGLAARSRWPFRARFTDIAGVEVNPVPVVENDGKETRLAVSNMSATAATRTRNNMVGIGPSPNIPTGPRVPNARGRRPTRDQQRT